MPRILFTTLFFLIGMNIFISICLQKTIRVYTLEDSVPIYISEVNYAGSTNPLGCKASDSTSKVTCANDKWIEIHNTSDKDLDIQGFTVGVGKRTADPSAFASTFNITSSLIIPANGFIVLLNKNSGLESTLKQGKFQYTSLGSLFGISNNTPGNKYIRVAIIKNGQTVSEVNIPDVDSLEKSDNIKQSESQKTSLNFDEKNQPTFSLTEYFPNNYGSPGLPFVTQKTVEKETNEKVDPVVVPSPVLVETTPNSIKPILPVNTQETMTAVENIQQKITVPAVKTIPQSTPAESKKISNVVLSEPLSVEKLSLIKERNTVETKEQVSISVPTKYKKMIEITSPNNLNSEVVLSTKVEKVKSAGRTVSGYENTNLQFNSTSEISGLNFILFNLVSALVVACEIFFTKINKNEYFANNFFKWLVCKRDSV